MTFTKIDAADLDYLRQELSNGGLKSVITLLVRWQIIFLSARIGRPIQLYKLLVISRSPRTSHRSRQLSSTSAPARVSIKH